MTFVCRIQSAQCKVINWTPPGQCQVCRDEWKHLGIELNVLFLFAVDGLCVCVFCSFNEFSEFSLFRTLYVIWLLSMYCEYAFHSLAFISMIVTFEAMSSSYHNRQRRLCVWSILIMYWIDTRTSVPNESCGLSVRSSQHKQTRTPHTHSTDTQMDTQTHTPAIHPQNTRDHMGKQNEYIRIYKYGNLDDRERRENDRDRARRLFPITPTWQSSWFRVTLWVFHSFRYICVYCGLV